MYTTLLALLALAGVAHAAGEPVVPAAELLLDLPAADEARAAGLVFLAQMERQGLVPEGTVAAAAPLPPGTLFRDMDAVCDLDGDGLVDVLSNDFDLANPPLHASGFSTVRAISGADGATLWTREALFWGDFRLGPYTTTRGGEAFPGGVGNVAPTFDADGDGACDVLALGYERVDGVAVPPILTVASTDVYTVELRLLSGRTGEDLWVAAAESLRADARASPILNPASVAAVRGFPTGFLAYATPDGPRVAVKTTDLTYAVAREPFGLTSLRLAGRWFQLLEERASVEAVETVDHLAVHDAATGELVWTRDLVSGGTGPFANLTWFTGAGDVTGDGAPDVVLDALVLANPRGSLEPAVPGGSPPLLREGRGMAVAAFDGALGDLVWSATVLDPEAARPNPPVEELFETLVWTHATLLGDLDGDGRDDVGAAYVAREENLGGSVTGAFVTHFVPVAGADGAAFWDVRQQGWGAMAVAGPGAVAVGLVDVPSLPAPGGRFPDKFVRLAVLDAADGALRWSYEKASPQDGLLSYHLALAQYGEALAPADLDGDGLRDPVTPAQGRSRPAADQMLLAAARHGYEVRAADDGEVLRAVEAWGPDGRVLDCGAPGTLTVLTGHARRLDLTRFDVASGAQLWRVPVWNDPTPRAASAGVDTTGLAARCRDTPDGRTFFALDLQAFSFARRHEVVPVHGFLDAAGAPLWILPAVRGDPPTTDLFEPYKAPREGPAPGLVAALAAPAGAAAGAVALALGGRLPILARLLGAALVAALALGFVASPALPTADALVLPDLAAPREAAAAPRDEAAPVRQDATADAPPLADLMDVARARLAPSVPALAAEGSRLEEAESIAFTYEVGDVDGDGVEDLVVDEYCLDWDVCSETIYFPEGAAEFVLGYNCGPMHFLSAVSGANGTLLWTKDITPRGPFWAYCAEEFVLGTVPTEAGVGVLLYRYTLLSPSGVYAQTVSVHDVMLLDPATGEPRWTHTERGWRETDLLEHDVADTFWLDAVLQAPTPAQRAVAGDVAPALFLRGVGWAQVVATTLVAPPGTSDAVVLLDDWQPREWAARLDVESGAVLWRAETFAPEPGRAVMPRLLDADDLEPGSWREIPVVERYWATDRCCLDVTGDGVPDLLFRTTEWNPAPNAKVAEPYFTDASVVAYDGATGEMLYDVVVAEDVELPRRARDRGVWTILSIGLTERAYDLRFEFLGDVDADGASDWLQHETFLDYDYRYVLSARSGRDGSELWRIESPRDLRTFVVGDADGDGGSDFLLVEWYGHEALAENAAELVTPRRNVVTLHAGRDASVLWRAGTVAAPLDALETYRTMRLNGLLDVDADGVGDVVVDDPLYLGDQTTVHRLSVLSGRDARPLLAWTSVGAFAVPSRIDDVTGDGRDDLAVLSGDANDLWVTVHDGATAEARWSRRVAALDAAGYARTLPNLRWHVLDNATGPSRLVADLHLEVTLQQVGYWIYSGGSDGNQEGVMESVRELRYTEPQILAVRADLGDPVFAFPRLDDEALLAHVVGATPGTQAFARILEDAALVSRADLAETVPATGAGIGAFGASFGAVLAAGRWVLRRRRLDAEVPDLD